MKFVPIDASDVEELAVLECENMATFLETTSERGAAAVRDSIAGNLRRGFKLIDSVLLGFYYWMPDEDCAVLLSVQVPRRLRSRGHGAMLMDHFQREAIRHGFAKLGLAVHTTNPAHAWYTRNGFEYVGEDGPDCHMLIKELR